jgi:hypothetical protein|tara:strand:- start:113 stop:661 length:549 start_codon:yes stop_codon:yes gene_type:complete
MTSRKWIKQSWDYHSQHIDDHGLSIGWDEWDECQTMCWCCGRQTKHLQRCHIVPKSLGGPDSPDNIVPLCGHCHDKAPDVDDKDTMFEWIAEQQNPLSGIGMGEYWHMFEPLKKEAERIYEKYGKVPTVEEMKPLIEANYNKVSTHGAQSKKVGLYYKKSTREWVAKKSFKDYETNLDVLGS